MKYIQLLLFFVEFGSVADAAIGRNPDHTRFIQNKFELKAMISNIELAMKSLEREEEGYSCTFVSNAYIQASLLKDLHLEKFLVQKQLKKSRRNQKLELDLRKGLLYHKFANVSVPLYELRKKLCFKYFMSGEEVEKTDIKNLLLDEYPTFKRQLEIIRKELEKMIKEFGEHHSFDLN